MVTAAALSKTLLRSCMVHRRVMSFLSPVCHSGTEGDVNARPSFRDGPGLDHFISNAGKFVAPRRGGSVQERMRKRKTPEDVHPYLTEEMLRGDGVSVYLDVHGCQMNVSDTEVVWSVLEQKGYSRTLNPREADVWLVVTCSIREGAEKKIWNKLRRIKRNRDRGDLRRSLKVGLLGCMAERLKESLLETKERLVDVVAGPDSYRDLPRLLTLVTNKSVGDDLQTAINVLLSVDETYADILPSRLSGNSVTGFVSIQRGCDNMCSYCIVPFTRGSERSRPAETVVDEVKHLVDQGVREVTLLGQNVNSYRDTTTTPQAHAVVETKNTPGFRSIYRPKVGGMRFAELLRKVSEVDPEVRIRFTSPHPKDFPDQVLALIASTPNVCNHLHLPAQCGSSRILESMRRGYTRESYLALVERVRRILPDVMISGDMIAGFCGETDEEFEETLSLIRAVKYTTLYTFPYSLREKTHAHRNLVDDVPEEVKLQRMQRMSEVFREEALILNTNLVGSEQLVLVEGESKRSREELQGRSDGHIKVIFPKAVRGQEAGLKPGDYCVVLVNDATSQVLKGEVVDSAVTLQEYYSRSNSRRRSQ